MANETRWPVPVDGFKLPKPAKVGEVFQRELQGVLQQAFQCVMLDDDDELIRITQVFTELAPQDAPATLVSVAQECGASQMFVAFHLPDSGPWADAMVENVAQIRRSLAEADIRLIDLFLTGGHVPTSMALRGWI